MNILFRRFREEDASDVKKVFVESLTWLIEYLELSLDTFDPNSQIFTPTFVLVVDSKIVGFSEVNDEGLIEKFYILPEHRFKGFGSHLLIHTKKAGGYWLYVNENNYPAIRFYEKHDFKNTGKSKSSNYHPEEKELCYLARLIDD